MDTPAAIAAAALLALAGLHSLLGERLLLGPLLALEPWPPLPLGRFLSRRTLRFAWHLTSVAWAGLAALAAGRPRDPFVVLVVTAVLAATGAIAFGATRGRHFAWALALAGAIAGAAQLGLVAAGARAGLGGAAGAAFGGIALLHVAWALGLSWGLGAALPEAGGRPAFRPPRWATLAVAGLAGVAAWTALGLAGLVAPPPLARGIALAGALALAARCVGDRATMGLFKRIRGTRFARWDDALFTPLCFALGAGLLLLAVTRAAG